MVYQDDTAKQTARHAARHTARHATARQQTGRPGQAAAARQQPGHPGQTAAARQQPGHPGQAAAARQQPGHPGQAAAAKGKKDRSSPGKSDLQSPRLRYRGRNKRFKSRARKTILQSIKNGSIIVPKGRRNLVTINNITRRNR